MKEISKSRNIVLMLIFAVLAVLGFSLSGILMNPNLASATTDIALQVTLAAPAADLTLDGWPMGTDKTVGEDLGVSFSGTNIKEVEVYIKDDLDDWVLVGIVPISGDSGEFDGVAGTLTLPAWVTDGEYDVKFVGIPYDDSSGQPPVTILRRIVVGKPPIIPPEILPPGVANTGIFMIGNQTIGSIDLMVLSAFILALGLATFLLVSSNDKKQAKRNKKAPAKKSAKKTPAKKKK